MECHLELPSLYYNFFLIVTDKGRKGEMNGEREG
jgi:hypothetical protein